MRVGTCCCSICADDGWNEGGGADFTGSAGEGTRELEWGDELHQVPCGIGEFADVSLRGVPQGNCKGVDAAQGIAFDVSTGWWAWGGVCEVPFGPQWREFFDAALGSDGEGI